jgi:hypothetical protein
LNMRRILYYYNHTKLNKELTSIFKDVEQWWKYFENISWLSTRNVLY